MAVRGRAFLSERADNNQSRYNKVTMRVGIRGLTFHSPRCRGRGQRDCETESVQGAGRSKGGRKPPDYTPDRAQNCERKNGESAARSYGWGGRIRTSEWRNQNPLPYHLATPQKHCRIAAGGRRRAQDSGASFKDQCKAGWAAESAVPPPRSMADTRRIMAPDTRPVIRTLAL